MKNAETVVGQASRLSSVATQNLEGRVPRVPIFNAKAQRCRDAKKFQFSRISRFPAQKTGALPRTTRTTRKKL